MDKEEEKNEEDEAEGGGRKMRIQVMGNLWELARAWRMLH